MLINAHVTPGRCLDIRGCLTVLNSERPKIVYNCGLSECNRVNSCLPDGNVQCN